MILHYSMQPPSVMSIPAEQYIDSNNRYNILCDLELRAMTCIHLPKVFVCMSRCTSLAG